MTWIRSAARTIAAPIRAHWLVSLLLVGAIGAALILGWIPGPGEWPDVPPWVVVAAVGLGGTAAAGYVVARAIFGAPEPDWSFLVEINIDDPRTPRIHRLSPATLERLRVVGTKGLGQPTGVESVYVCRHYNGDAEAPIAHCTWADLPSDADLLGTKPSAIEDEVAALRETYEETHGAYGWVLDHLYMVVRRLDFARSTSQTEVLDGHLTPSMTDRSISEVVDEQIPDDLLPERVGDGPDEDEDQPDGDAGPIEQLLEAAQGPAPEAAADGGPGGDDG